MKVAVLLTGHIRKPFIELCYNQIRSLICDRHDTDIFISTWDIDNDDHSVTKESNFKNTTNLVLDLYKPKNYFIENTEQFYKNRFASLNPEGRHLAGGALWVERWRDQWHMVKKGWELIDNPEQYDVIVRIRFDLYLKTLEFNDLGSGPNIFLIPCPHVGLTDHFAYGSPAVMEKYCKAFDYIQSMYEGGIDTSDVHPAMWFYITQVQKLNFVIVDNVENGLGRNLFPDLYKQG